MWFEPIGPVGVPVEDKAVNTSKRGSFWAEAETELEGVKAAIGCYVFFNECRGVLKPWYVGKTCALKGFYGEIFQDHKCELYNEVTTKNGAAKIVLLPALTESGRICRAHSSASDEIDWLEKMLIGIAYRKNPKLLNISDTKYLRSCVIPGVLGNPGQGKPSTGAQVLKKALS